MFIDTHFHLEKTDDVEQILNEARDHAVSFFILGGTSKEDNLFQLSCAKSFSDVFVCAGFHPSEAAYIEKEDLVFLETLIKENPKEVVGVGEIGLDYHYDGILKEKQMWLFEEQIKLAIKYQLPIVIHSRDATLDTYTILKKYQGQVSGVIHCFSGSLEVAKQYIDLGYVLGIGGVVTFKNSHLKDVLKEIPYRHIVLETDSPFLSPLRGCKNAPCNIPVIAQFLAQLYNVNVEEIGYVTSNTAKKLFFLREE